MTFKNSLLHKSKEKTFKEYQDLPQKNSSILAENDEICPVFTCPVKVLVAQSCLTLHPHGL